LEVEEFVLEDEGDYGVYLIEGEIHESNTSKLSYSWGVDKNQIRTQFVEPAAREIIREIKKRLGDQARKVVSQDEAISIAYAGIKKHKEQYTVFGTEMHQAFQAFDEGKPVNLPTPKHQAYFQGFLYFRRQHEVKPILIEKLLVCPHCGLATQIDNFSEVDGLNTIMDYKTGRTIGFNTPFQLAINKHVLENLGYRVDRTWAVHIQDLFGYPLEMCAPWEDVELRLKNADLKRKTLNPKIYPRELSGNKKEASSETLKTSEEQESVPAQDVQGHQLPKGVPVFLAIDAETENAIQAHIVDTYLGQEGKPLLETTEKVSPTAVPTQKRRNKKPHKNPSASTSLHRKATRQRSPRAREELSPSVVRKLSHAKRRKLQAA
jgi:hypothetical protein